LTCASSTTDTIACSEHRRGSRNDAKHDDSERFCGSNSISANLASHARDLGPAMHGPYLRRKLSQPRRTTNLPERTFVEVRRRTKVIGRFPGETNPLSLIWAVLELSSHGWRGVIMTPTPSPRSNASADNNTPPPPATPRRLVAA
jgi:Transposase, Mutator family